MDGSEIVNRKDDHLNINIHEQVSSKLTNGLNRFRLRHCALPNLSLDDVDTSIEFLGRRINYPIIISSMTGGTPTAHLINRTLARVAQRFKIAMAVGSQRIAIEQPLTRKTFAIRSDCPDIPLIANLGAIQLNYGFGIEECLRAVEMIESDALILHLNCLQEVLQPEGNTNFYGLLDKIEMVCRLLPVPVIVKEVGWGMSANVARSLYERGVRHIDVAGAGGTSFSEVERKRIACPIRQQIAAEFTDWGIPTAVAIREVRSVASDIFVIGSGGIRSGIDAVKAFALGANMVGIARHALLSTSQGEEALENYFEILVQTIKVALFSIGVARPAELSLEHLILLD
ncbi:MAG: type 2 isopentenyl-diphosphate Delta-isomerase [Bacilli bacterium]